MATGQLYLAYGGRAMATADELAAHAAPADEPAGWDADEAVTRLFIAHYRPLVRLATLLVGDSGLAEEITQDAYVRLHARWRWLREPDKALAYLRTSVVNRSRSVLRHRRVAAGYLATARAPADAPSAEVAALGVLDTSGVMAALRRLPARQRETLVLRYFLDLSEAEIAESMGVSRGSVKSHAARGLAALRRAVERAS